MAHLGHGLRSQQSWEPNQGHRSLAEWLSSSSSLNWLSYVSQMETPTSRQADEDHAKHSMALTNHRGHHHPHPFTINPFSRGTVTLNFVSLCYTQE